MPKNTLCLRKPHSNLRCIRTATFSVLK